MGLPALKDALEDGSRSFVSRDWAAEAAGINTIDDFAEFAKKGVADAAQWRHKTELSLKTDLEEALRASKTDHREQVLSDLHSTIDAVDRICRDMKPKAEKRVFENHEVLKSPMTSSQRRYLRKQLQVADQVGIDLYNFYVDAYYTLLGLQSRIEDEGEPRLPTFTDGAALAGYLRKETA